MSDIRFLLAVGRDTVAYLITDTRTATRRRLAILRGSAR